MSLPRLPTVAFAVIIAAAAPFAAAAQPAGVQAPPPAAWKPTSLPWVSANRALGPLPQTVAVPTKAYSYAAQSAPLDPFAKTQPTILRVVIEVKSGSVGVFRSSADGASQLSKEMTFRTPGRQVIYFRLLPRDAPAVVVVRNFDGEGLAGEVVIVSTDFAREGELSNAELSAAVAGGLL